MEPYDVIFKPSVEKDLRRLPADAAARIMTRVDQLGAEPLGRGSVKLAGGKHLYRVRVGDYRVVYAVDSDARQVLIHYVRHRRDVYRSL